MKTKVAEHFPTSLEDLKAIIKEVSVNEISLEFCLKLARSMSWRIAAVLATKGQTTKNSKTVVNVNVFLIDCNC